MFEYKQGYGCGNGFGDGKYPFDLIELGDYNRYDNNSDKKGGKMPKRPTKKPSARVKKTVNRVATGATNKKKRKRKPKTQDV